MIATLLNPLARVIRKARSLVKKNVPLIDEQLWKKATSQYRFVQNLSAEENRRLRLIASDFLAHKTITGASGFIVSDLMRAQIAAQACILVLELGVQNFDGWSEVVVYPGQFVPEREVIDENGVVHTTRDPLAGEAWLHGPVVLSYDDVARAGESRSSAAGWTTHNVVIHEFAHKLDMLNGEPNGFPPLHRGMNKETWRRAFMEAYLEFCEAVDRADAREHYDDGEALNALPIDPYGSESPAEFFAVISESFFETPATVLEAFPAVYAQLKLFYRQDPATRMLD
jgi:MtfA peptidase